MFKVKGILFPVLIGLLFVGSAPAEKKFVEGKHFEKLSPSVPTSTPLGKIEVLEFFWYGCPHCFEFEIHVAKWLENKKHYVSFARVPAVFSENWLVHAKAFYAAAELGIIEKSHFALFESLHVKREKLFTETDISKFFIGLGKEESLVQKSLNSFGTANRAQRAQSLTKKVGISGVPSMVIDGKYRSSARLAGGYDNLLEVVDFLAEKEHRNSD